MTSNLTKVTSVSYGSNVNMECTRDDNTFYKRDNYSLLILSISILIPQALCLEDILVGTQWWKIDGWKEDNTRVSLCIEIDWKQEIKNVLRLKFREIKPAMYHSFTIIIAWYYLLVV